MALGLDIGIGTLPLLARPAGDRTTTICKINWYMAHAFATGATTSTIGGGMDGGLPLSHHSSVSLLLALLLVGLALGQARMDGRMDGVGQKLFGALRLAFSIDTPSAVV